MTIDAESRRARRPNLARLLVVIGIVVALAAAVFVLVAQLSDDDDPATTPDDGGTVVLPQNPSLALVLDGSTWFVVNDGNVTMSGIEVGDGSDDVVCTIDTIAPDDREACEAAAEDAELTVVGFGPQGQRVEVDSD